MAIAWSTLRAALHTWVTASSGLSAANVIWAGQAGGRPATPYISLRITFVRPTGQDWLEGVDNPLVVADQPVDSVNSATDVITRAAHSRLTGDGPFRYTTTGTWAGMTGKDFWIIRLSANTYQVGESFQDAMNGVPFDIPSAGTGNHTLTDTPKTVRQGQEITLRSRGQRECVLTLQCFASSAISSSDPTAILNAVVSGANLESNRAALQAAGVGIGSFEAIRSLDGLIGQTVFEPRGILECRFNIAEEVSENATIIQFVEVENLVTETSTYVPENPNP